MHAILVVEDQPELARLLCRVLSAHGYHPRVASSCAEALLLPGLFDCAILDISLPDGTGVALAETLTVGDRLRSVVFFSAESDPKVLEAARQWGPLVSKAAEMGELLEAVQRGIERANALAASGSGTFAAARSRDAARKSS